MNLEVRQAYIRYKTRADKMGVNYPPKKGVLIQGACRIWGTLRAINNAISSQYPNHVNYYQKQSIYKVVHNISPGLRELLGLCSLTDKLETHSSFT